MSAFVVTEEHIRYIVNAALHPTINRHSQVSASFPDRDTGEKNSQGDSIIQTAGDQIGQMLWAENHRSVNNRYCDSLMANATPIYVHKEETIPLNHAQILKAIACLEYQSCEHEGWMGSQAQQFLDRLRQFVVQTLPGYEEAEWAISGAATYP